ncbi:hypothetical protein GA707_08465 [Nostocoides sp. F2B08]|uniref:hypothetical protein n=1 Tax=Nostocoides sp. F2B08 TaxID=2653936 RepID=UPI001262FA75|nr:hypothetical protein [Tetrasphaera sp. F2B08]KAB7744625.1 hypothetical protein GA707_08465 [Tetrasphaera sp. F2B08]
MSGLLSALVAGAVTRGVFVVGRERARILGLEWQRTNHAGRTVTLWEGAAFATGAAAGSLVGGSPSGVLAAVGGGAFGALDDHRGDSDSKGLRGHLGALRRGRVTTGAVKIVGIGATGVASVVLLDRGREGRDRLQGVASTLLGGAVVAASANLVNLLDLRPGRALKATIIVAGPLAFGAGSAPAGIAAGAASAVIAPDLRGEAMLGDTGANAAGALVGLALVGKLGPRGRSLALLGLTALTLASERVSFTSVIESTPVLRELDRWGRRT